MKLLQSLNLLVAFLLELALLVVFGYWGFQFDGSIVIKYILGLGLPLLVATLWGWRLAPKAAKRLKMPWLVIVKLVLFGIATLALYSTGQVPMALLFGGITIVHFTLAEIWNQH